MYPAGGLAGLVSNGGGVGTEWEWDGNGEGVGTGTPFRDKPPRLSRKGALRAGSSINAPLRDNRGGGGGGLVSKGCVE